MGNFIDKPVKLSERVNQLQHIYLRFQTKHVGNTMTLVSRGGADLSNGVHELDTHHPLVDCELNFSSKVMDMADQGGENQSVSSRDIGANGIDAVLGEVGVKS